MIQNFKSRELRRYWQTGQTRGLNADRIAKLHRMLDALDCAEEPEDMNIPGFHFHELKGARKGVFSLRVSGNWRLTFEWDDAPVNVDLEDYH